MIGVYLEWTVYDPVAQVYSCSYKSSEEAHEDLRNKITRDWSNQAVVFMLG